MPQGIPCSSPAQSPAERLLAAFPPGTPLPWCPRLPLAGFPARRCWRGGGVRVGDSCLAQCSASSRGQRLAEGHWGPWRCRERRACSPAPRNYRFGPQLAPSQWRGGVIPEGKKMHPRPDFLLQGKPGGLGEFVHWGNTCAAGCKVWAWGETQPEPCIHQCLQMLTTHRSGGSGRKTRCVSTPGSHHENRSRFVLCYTRSWQHLAPQGRRGAVPCPGGAVGEVQRSP